MATVPVPFAPGPGMVFPQALPLQIGQDLQLGPIWVRAFFKTSSTFINNLYSALEAMTLISLHNSAMTFRVLAS